MKKKEAIALGLNRYCTDVPCRNGHIAERIVSTGKCIECHKATKKRYDAAHPDRKRARMRNWQNANRDKVRAANNAYAAANRERARDRSRIHYEKISAVPEKMKERSKKTRRWQINNPEKHTANSCAWQKRNPDKVVAISAARRARKMAAPGRYTSADIHALFDIQRGKCAHSWCEKSIIKKRHVDHIIPLVAGGSNDRSNLQLLCPSCNCSKGAKHPVAVAQAHGMLL